MTDKEIRAAAVEYVATHKHDSIQVLTNSECQVHRPVIRGRGRDARDVEVVHVQVWVEIPYKDLIVPNWVYTRGGQF